MPPPKLFDGSKVGSQDLLDLLNKSTSGVFFWDPALDRVEWSAEFFDALGFQESDSARYEDVELLLHPDDRSMVTDAIQRARSHHGDYEISFRIENARGDHKRFEAHGKWGLRDDGSEYLTGFVRDVTQLCEVRFELAESEKRLATLADSFEGAVFRDRMKADGTDSIDYMSDGAEQVWGLTAAEIIGDPGKVWATVHPDDVAGVEDAFAQGTINLNRIHRRWRVVLSNGYTRWIECRCVPKRLENGDTLWDGFVIDVSEAMAAREELRAKTEMLGQSQKMEAIGRISGGIAHDFNNLLAIILGNAELIEASRLDDLDRESLEAIVSACSKGADLTRRLLSFARKSRLEPKVVHLTAIIEGMLPFLQRVLPESISLGFQSENGSGDAVSVDTGLLESSILNVVLNARDAMPRGGTISIRLFHASPEFVALELRDTGEGISEELLPRVTEPFITSKGPEMGSGLGLAMVDGFVDQSGGKLEIRSEIGEGTTVRVLLPTTKEAPTNAKQPDQTVRSNDHVPDRVLLVEDEQQVRLTISRQLRRLGIQVDAVETGAQALEFLDERGAATNLLISDIVMPGTPDGRELAKIFRSRYPTKPAILISGYTAHESEQDEEKDPLLMRLAKPVERDTLEKTIVELHALSTKL